MKKVTLVLAFIGLTVFTSTAQKTDSLSVETPEIIFKAIEIDYGVIARNSDGTRIFEYTNSGKVPLIVSNVVASCGCTVVEWGKDPIKPGEKGSFKVKYNTAIAGPFHKSVRVFSNAKTNPVVLTIKGDVKPSESLNASSSPVEHTSSSK